MLSDNEKLRKTKISLGAKPVPTAPIYNRQGRYPGPWATLGRELPWVVNYSGPWATLDRGLPWAVTRILSPERLPKSRLEMATL